MLRLACTVQFVIFWEDNQKGWLKMRWWHTVSIMSLPLNIFLAWRRSLPVSRFRTPRLKPRRWKQLMFNLFFWKPLTRHRGMNFGNHQCVSQDRSRSPSKFSKAWEFRHVLSNCPVFDSKKRCQVFLSNKSVDFPRWFAASGAPQLGSAKRWTCWSTETAVGFERLVTLVTIICPFWISLGFVMCPGFMLQWSCTTCQSVCLAIDQCHLNGVQSMNSRHKISTLLDSQVELFVGHGLVSGLFCFVFFVSFRFVSFRLLVCVIGLVLFIHTSCRLLPTTFSRTRHHTWHQCGDSHGTGPLESDQQNYQLINSYNREGSCHFCFKISFGGIPNSSSLMPCLTTWAHSCSAVVLPMRTMLSPKGVQKQSHGCSCQGCKATNHS